MSEKKGPFDAIKITPLFGMDWVLSLLRACREINKDKPEHQGWIDEAYRVLEAMGRIDKAELHNFIYLYLADLDPNPILEFMETVYMALPEKEKL